MMIFSWFLTVLMIAVKRLYAQKGLTLATLAGLIVITALMFSIPLYADAVYFRVLHEELAQPSSATSPRPSARSPFTFMFQYIGAWHGLLSWEDMQPLDEYLAKPVIADLGLPRQLFVRYFKTENFFLFPLEDAAYTDVKDPLTSVNFGFISGIESQITVLEGAFPGVADSAADSTVEVLVSENLASRLGIHVDETYLTFTRQEVNGVRQTTLIPIRVAGIWRPSDPNHAFWFTPPETLHELLLVPEETFLQRINPYMEGEIATAMWYMIMDGSDVHASDAGPLLKRITAIQQQTSALLPDISLQTSPVAALQRYQRAATLLTILLYAFSAPILLLILIFINLVIRLAVERQRNEIAVLRSRGATAGQIIGIAGLEATMLGGVALLVGLPVGELIAKIMGQTQTFLNFTMQGDLRVAVTRPTLFVGLVIFTLTLTTQIIPNIEAAGHTIVSYKQVKSRVLRLPWWQRAWVDAWLFVPAAYGTYILTRQGSLIWPDNSEIIENGPFQNPLLFLVPALTIFVCTLFYVRFLPILMAALAWVAAHLGSVGLLLATRQLARSPGYYRMPMILLITTLSLSTFTATLAQTLDNHLADQAYYYIGADMRLADLGQISEGGSVGNGEGNAAEAAQTTAQAELRWLFLPASEYLKVPGIEAATRVGNYVASTRLSGGYQVGTFMGLDRIAFPEVAFWRWDFAPTYLGELMNALAMRPDGILLPRTFMNQHALTIGDTMQVNVDIYNQRVEMPVRIIGGFDLFPTWYPADGPLFVGNLDYFFEQAGGQYPYDVWLNIEPGVNQQQIAAGISNLNLRTLEPDTALLNIVQEQRRPERQGLFGLLSIGFGAAAIFTVAGFILFTLFSFRQRFIELGILRAIGLSSAQVALYLAWELAFLILTGLIVGTILGVFSSQLYIPYLQVGHEAADQIPSFLVEIAWPAVVRIYILFGLLFFVALMILGTLLLKMNIFQAIKLGETV